MSVLRDLVEGCGATLVETHLQSGNVVFRHPRRAARELEERLGQVIREHLGLAVVCLVRSREEIAGTVRANPFPDRAGSGARLLVHFLGDDPSPEARIDHDPSALAPGAILVGARAIYQWCPDGVLAAPAVGKYVEHRWRVAVTTRNWNTLTRVQELLATR
jgi:uncharacterized protein (DUF1697 family)